MSTEKSKTRQKLETQAAELDVTFDDDTSSADLKKAIAAAKAAAEAADTDTSKPQTDAQAATPPEQPGSGEGGGNDAPPAQQTEEEAMITVTGPKKGRWRAGSHFTAEPAEIPLGELSEDQIAALQADPKITVEGLPADRDE